MTSTRKLLEPEIGDLVRGTSRASVAAEALRRRATSPASVSAAAAALRRRAGSRGSIAAAALRRLGS